MDTAQSSDMGLDTMPGRGHAAGERGPKLPWTSWKPTPDKSPGGKRNDFSKDSTVLKHRQDSAKILKPMRLDTGSSSTTLAESLLLTNLPCGIRGLSSALLHEHKPIKYHSPGALCRTMVPTGKSKARSLPNTHQCPPTLRSGKSTESFRQMSAYTQGLSSCLTVF